MLPPTFDVRHDDHEDGQRHAMIGHTRIRKYLFFTNSFGVTRNGAHVAHTADIENSKTHGDPQGLLHGEVARVRPFVP